MKRIYSVLDLKDYGYPALLFAISFVCSLFFGAASLHPIDFFYQISDHQLQAIILDIRLPRTLATSISGASLAVGGALCQTLFRNPIASPSVLGVNSASAFFAVLTLAFGLGDRHIFAIPLACLLGSSVGVSLLLMLWKKMSSHRSTDNLLLFGIALGMLWSASISLVVFLELDNGLSLRSLFRWLIGDFSFVLWDQTLGVIPLFIIGICTGLYLLTKLSPMQLGEDVARTLGVNVEKLQFFSVATIAILIATSTALAGPITFIGLLVPHIARRSRTLNGKSHRAESHPPPFRLGLLSMLLGASLVTIADTLCRTIGLGLSLQVGIPIAWLGSLYFLYLCFRRGAGTLDDQV